jgi:prepilin peptidase CpaA
MLLAGLIVHRVARASPLRNLAPGWASWQAKGKFPMGLALGPTLALYLGLAAFSTV